MRACFADNIELPIACSHDINEAFNCNIASAGVPRDRCRYWRPDLALKVAQDILGDEWKLVKHEVICARCGIRQDGAGSKEVTF